MFLVHIHVLWQTLYFVKLIQPFIILYLIVYFYHIVPFLLRPIKLLSFQAWEESWRIWNNSRCQKVKLHLCEFVLPLRVVLALFQPNQAWRRTGGSRPLGSGSNRLTNCILAPRLTSSQSQRRQSYSTKEFFLSIWLIWRPKENQ